MQEIDLRERRTRVVARTVTVCDCITGRRKTVFSGLPLRLWTAATGGCTKRRAEHAPA